MTNLAYPIGDLLLILLVVAVLGLTGWRPGRMWLVFGAVALLLAITVANIAGLLLVQLRRRVREFAIRQAIGGSRVQIIRAAAMIGSPAECVEGLLRFASMGVTQLALRFPDEPTIREFGTRVLPTFRDRARADVVQKAG